MVSAQRSADVSSETLRRFETELVERAIHHRVPGPAAAAYRKRGLDVPERLRANQVASSIARMSALHDFEFARRMLAGRGIDLLVFKGEVLTTLVSGDDWERPTSDLDVLVRPERLEEVVDLLVAGGAIHLDRNWRRLREDVLGELHLVLPAGTALDLHWNLVVRSASRSAFAPDHDALFETSRPIDLDGTTTTTFGATETLVYSCLHGAISGGHLLVWLHDIERLVLNERPDWSEVIGVARRWRCGLVVGAMLQRAQCELGLAVPRQVIDELLANRALRVALAGVNRVCRVADTTGDGPLLRLITRSIDVDGWATLRSLVVRPAQRAVRFALRRPQPSALDYFVDTPARSDDERAAYFDAVRAETIALRAGR